MLKVIGFREIEFNLLISWVCNKEFYFVLFEEDNVIIWVFNRRGGMRRFFFVFVSFEDKDGSFYKLKNGGCF